jgi:hypothetical protein
MLLLVSTSDKIQVVSGSALNLDVHASYMDFDGTNVTPGRRNTTITTATTTDVVLAPASSVTRNLKTLTVRNRDASVNTITVKHTDGTTVSELFKATLQPDDVIEFVDGVGFIVRPAYAASQAQNYSTANQSPTAATATYLTGSLISLPRTPSIGTMFRWTIGYSKTAAGTATTTWDIRFGTNGTTGDTARNSATGPTETAAADDCQMTITAIVRGPIGASCVVQSNFANLDTGVTAGHKTWAKNVTSAAFDITPSGTKVGLVITTGTADVDTINSVIAEAFNL